MLFVSLFFLTKQFIKHSVSSSFNNAPNPDFEISFTKNVELIKCKEKEQGSYTDLGISGLCVLSCSYSAIYPIFFLLSIDIFCWLIDHYLINMNLNIYYCQMRLWSTNRCRNTCPGSKENRPTFSDELSVFDAGLQSAMGTHITTPLRLSHKANTFTIDPLARLDT